MRALLSVVVPAGVVVLAGRKLELELATLTKLTLYISSPALIVDRLPRTGLPAAEGIRIAAAFAPLTAAEFGGDAIRAARAVVLTKAWRPAPSRS